MAVIEKKFYLYLERVDFMNQKSYQAGAKLYLIPTPIGNREDMTIRAINVLKEVDVLFCEDTRVTAQLLKYLDITKKLIHSDDHNEDKMKELALSYLQEGKTIGLVTDRGTPIISDPGYKVVSFILDHGYPVISLPGPTAFVPALTMSGLAPSPFLFYGFLNAKKTKREKELKKLSSFPYTMLFYEAPHRLMETLESIQEILGDREIAICREISKIHEEIYRGTVSSIKKDVEETLKGEYVLVVAGNTQEEDYSDLSIVEHVKLYTEDGMSEKDAIKEVAKQRQVPKSIIYKEYHLGK